MKTDRELLMESFQSETDEDLRLFESAIVALEADPGDMERIHAIFRKAHSLKGNAATLGLMCTSQVAHALEEVLERHVEERLPVTKSTASLLLEAVDAIRALIAEAATGAEEKPHAFANLVQRLNSYDPTTSAEVDVPISAATTERTEHEPADDRTRSLRVAIEKLDKLLDLMGEITVAQGRLNRAIQERRSNSEFFTDPLDPRNRQV